MRNSSLDNVRNKMKEYLQNYGNEAQASIMSMLKRQGVIKRNTDGSLNVEMNDTNILEFEEGMREIGKFIDKKGFTDSFVENQILKRKEEALDRLYHSDASDVVKNPFYL